MRMKYMSGRGKRKEWDEEKGQKEDEEKLVLI